MKKAIFVATLSLGVFFVQAQKRGHASSDVEFGVKGGLNFANVSVDNSTNPDTKISGNLGVLAHIHLDRQFAVQPELLFSGQGYKYTVAGTTVKVPLNYITLPILGQFMFGEGFRVETGPQPGVLVAAHYKANGNSTNAKSDIKSFDLSWAFGFGYLTSSGFGVDARYNLGLTDISESNASKFRNSVFALGVFYQFKHM